MSVFQGLGIKAVKVLLLFYHISSCVEYSVDPISTSGGLYHRVTTSWEYVRVGTDLALASPVCECV